MSDLAAEVPVEGRPSAGAAMAQDLSEAAKRRTRSRNVGALRALAPYLARHKADTAWAGASSFSSAPTGSTGGSVTGGGGAACTGLAGPGAVPSSTKVSAVTGRTTPQPTRSSSSGSCVHGMPVVPPQLAKLSKRTCTNRSTSPAITSIVSWIRMKGTTPL